MKKAFYVLIVMVVMLGMLPSAAEAKKVTGMYIADVHGTYIINLNGTVTYTVWVTIKDINGNVVPGARVMNQAIFGLDTKPTVNLTATTNENGIATFVVGSTSHWMFMSVENVIKLGYTYLEELNLEDGIEISAW